MKIVFTGGGSGGHIFPLISIIRELRRISGKHIDFYYIGPKDELSFIYFSQEDVKIIKIAGGKMRRYFSFQNIIDIFLKIPFSFFQSLFYLAFMNPALVLSKGGEGSIAVTFAAKILGINIFLHESDVLPGLSNQKTSRWAKKIFTSFEKTEYFEPKKCILVGNPIREAILGGDIETAKELFSITLTKPVLLVLGGSQGAQAINDFVLNSINTVLEDYEVIHVAGRKNYEEVTKESQVSIHDNFKKYYHLYDFLEEEKLKHAYQIADLIIARAGSGLIFEIAALGKPSILIPLSSESSNNHQAKNAYTYEKMGACIVIEQDNLTPHFFLDNVKMLFLNKEKLASMKQAALLFAKPLAAKTIAREILEYLG